MRAVPDTTTETDDFDTAVGLSLVDNIAPEPMFPPFEDIPVELSETKISGLSTLNDSDLLIQMNDRVRIVIETRATAVSHSFDKEGRFVRQQQLKVIAVDLAPWNPLDPHDDGILRARP